ncbi:MAG TPA: hypothetical protein VHZ95_18885, partial [Polyangiales bacterium]|nr:hypothetical protein [Polyangiales bacterium]
GVRADDARHKPPQAAFDACAKLASGDACSVTFDDGHAVDGTCHAGPDGSTALACMPAHGHCGPPKEAVDACQNLAAGASCSVTFDDKSIDGTCHESPDGKGPRACMPTAPPSK